MHVSDLLFLIYINILECFQKILEAQNPLKSWGQHFEDFKISSDKPSCNPSSNNPLAYKFQKEGRI